jgi:hypothetical protein
VITRRQALIAEQSLVAVFGPDGMEVTVAKVHPSFDSLIGEDNWGLNRAVYRFDELTPTRQILRLEECNYEVW